METILLSVGIFLLVVVLMAVGVIFSNIEIKGSCGGLTALFGKGSCEICENKDQCERKKGRA